MKCLAENLAFFGSNQVVWFLQDSSAVTASTLASTIAGLDAEQWRGKRVALGSMPAIELAAALVFLDGLAEAILLLPGEEDGELRRQRLMQGRIDEVVENEGFGFSRVLNPHGGILPASASSEWFRGSRPLATTWLLPTSGTTGTPKLIPHSIQSLTRSMRPGKRADEFLWGSLYSLRRFAGLQVFLQSWMSGSALLLNEETANPMEVSGRLARAGCNALSATPSMWRKLSMHPSFDLLKLKQITLGGEVVDQPVLDLLATRFPDARITHIYASTEAGVGFAVRDGKSGFPCEYLDGSPSGVAMKVDENGHLLFRRSPETDAQDRTETSAWIDSGDVVRRDGDRFYFLGRANGSINVGGNKVMPEEVESVIRELPEVAFVQVRAKRSAVMGNLVEAAVIASHEAPLDAVLRKKIVLHCRSRLEGYKVPVAIVEARDFALSASGKLLRVSAE